MTAEKPEGDVALLCDWLRKHTESGVPIPFAAERAIILLEELDDARGAAAFYVRESDGIRDAVVKQGARIESQAIRIAELEAALRNVWNLMDNARAALNKVRPLYGSRALSAGQGEAK